MGEEDHICTIAYMLLGARGYKTSTECTVYEEETGNEHPLSSAMSSYRDGRFHIVMSESRLEYSGKASDASSHLSLYIIEQRKYDLSNLPRTFPQETLVFEKINRETTVFIPGSWQKELESLISVADS